MKNRTALRGACALFMICFATIAHAQVFNKLEDFDGTNGATLFSMTLIQGRDGNLYGTTFYGGRDTHDGIVFRLTAEGLTTLYDFCSQANCLDGQGPNSGLLLASNGSLVGTTAYGGTNGIGTWFTLTREGSLTSSSLTHGANPSASFTRGISSSLYGSTQEGGTGFGSIFKVSPAGVLTTLHDFNGSDGAYPNAALTLGPDGNFYGTTDGGGIPDCSGGCGTVFRMTPSGTLTTLHAFSAAEGNSPYGGLLLRRNGKFYGVTRFGGKSNAGTSFRMNSKGEISTIHNFCSQAHCVNGAYPFGGLIQGTDGNLYGTTLGGGGTACDCGTIFRMAASGRLTVLHNFDGANGASPYAALLQATNGDFYGVTGYGGTSDFGTVFRLSMGLAPFVSLNNEVGRIGQTSGILGQGFTGTTSVMLNGVAASYTVVSDTYITATVPVGATTGYVTVTTPSGTLTSNVPFHVIK